MNVLTNTSVSLAKRDITCIQAHNTFHMAHATPNLVHYQALQYM